MEIARRVYENSYSMSSLFPISPICCFHSITRGSGDLRIRRAINFCGEAKVPLLKKLSKLRIRNREVTFMRHKELSKFEESRIPRAKYLS